MELKFAEVNWLAVAAAAFAMWIMGAAWYMGLGKTWQRLNNYSDEVVAGIAKCKPGGVNIWGMLLCYVVVAFALAVLMKTFGVSTLAGGMTLGAVCALGFAATIGLTTNIASPQGGSAWMFDTVYQVLIFLAAGAILAAMP